MKTKQKKDDKLNTSEGKELKASDYGIPGKKSSRCRMPSMYTQPNRISGMPKQLKNLYWLIAL